MYTSKIHAVFSNFDDGQSAIEALVNAGVSAKQIKVVGEDCDAFRFSTATLHAKKLDNLIVIMAGIGLFAGIAWGLNGIAWGVHGLPGLTSGTPSIVMSGIMGAFAGAMLGILCGAHIGGILHLDNRPYTNADLIPGQVNGGTLAISIATDAVNQLDSLQQILLDNSASKMAIEYANSRA